MPLPRTEITILATIKGKWVAKFHYHLPGDGIPALDTKENIINPDQGPHMEETGNLQGYFSFSGFCVRVWRNMYAFSFQVKKPMRSLLKLQVYSGRP